MTADDPATAFAPAARADARTLEERRIAFLADATAVSMLEAMPGPAMVLNAERQIIALNRQLVDILPTAELDEVLGRRFGEAAHCIHANEAPGGCGTSEHCVTCGAANAMVDCLATRARVQRECRITTGGRQDGGALDFRVHANHLEFGGESCLVIGLTDISGEKRREVLERVFFHDLLNEVGGLRGIAEILVDTDLEPAFEDECKRDLFQLSGAVVDEIRAHREMLAAERGKLVIHVEDLSVVDVLEGVAHLYRHHPAAANRSIDLLDGAPTFIRTDANLLRRSLGNLVKNALEATRQGGAVALGARPEGRSIRFFVRNPGVIPQEIQLQIFQRSFSTKGEVGRGIGTYSVRLFVERHLGGTVGFVCEEGRGTEFFIVLPERIEASSADRAA